MGRGEATPLGRHPGLIVVGGWKLEDGRRGRLPHTDPGWKMGDGGGHPIGSTAWDKFIQPSACWNKLIPPSPPGEFTRLLGSSPLGIYAFQGRHLGIHYSGVHWVGPLRVNLSSCVQTGVLRLLALNLVLSC